MEQIGRYRILDELGRGAAGIVYRAQDPTIGRVIAIKTIRLSDFTDEAERGRLRERLVREAQSAGILSHPNIVTIYDIAEEGGLAYIFMEFVDGPPLERILNAREPLDGSKVLSILRQAAVALDYAHKKGIVHRDIKPANILIHDGSMVKITDFGVAKILSQQMTQSGVMMGTPNYMAPEQVQGHSVDGRTDQFALAVVAYEILTGEKPFLADQLPSLLYRIVREDPVPPQHLNPSVSAQMEAVLKKALSKNAIDRYGTCVDFIEALSVACHASPGWHPLPRSSAENMPTMAGPVVNQRAAGDRGVVAREDPPMFASALPRSGEREKSDNESGNPLLKSFVWMLVGIGLVGAVLFVAQKYLFNRSTEPAGAPPEAQVQQQVPAGEAPAPKPSPIGQPRASEEAAKQGADNPPEATSPATPAPETPRQNPAPVAAPSTSSATTPRADARIQFITDPPGAQITIDGNADLSCKAPCVLPLSPGRHALSASLPGYRPFPRVFNVPQDADIFLQLAKASGTLSVTSNPIGATIEINGQAQPQRTPAIFNFPPGMYHVKVARNGAFLDFDVQIRDGEFVNKRVDF